MWNDGQKPADQALNTAEQTDVPPTTADDTAATGAYVSDFKPADPVVFAGRSHRFRVPSKFAMPVVALLFAVSGIALNNASHAATATINLKPTSDISSSGVTGYNSTSTVSTNLWQQVDDGTTTTSADTNTYVQTLRGTPNGSHITGYSGAPTGTVSAVTANIRAQRTKFISGSATVVLYDGSTVLKTGPVHSLNTAWTNYADTFTGLNVTSANNLRAEVKFAGTGTRGTFSYTQIWLAVTYDQASLNTPPAVAITAPQSGANVTGVVPVTGTATDDTSVSKVELQIDGGAFQPVTGTSSWAFDWDTTGLTGTHTLTARATDGSGQSSLSTTTVNTNPPPAPSATTTNTNPLAVKVSANRLVDNNGALVQLRGVNRSGTQYACIEGWGIFDGPTDATALSKIKGWGANSVRVSLNEDCWLGINGVSSSYGGTAYQTAIKDYVARLNAQGLRVIIDLHWNNPGTTPATDQQTMPDRDHSPAFWSGVAEAFKSNPSVLFDLYNEAHPDSNHNTTAAWTCVRDGGTCPGVAFVAAGSQELLNAVRNTGATNVVLVGGPQYAGVVDQWMAYKPNDPLNQLAASIHIYYNTAASPEWAPCYLQSCWDNTMAPLALKVPVIIGEVGEHDCGYSLISGTPLNQQSLLNWSDSHGVSYLGWSWITSDCAAEPALISNYDGTPNAYGAGLRDHLLALPH